MRAHGERLDRTRFDLSVICLQRTPSWRDTRPRGFRDSLALKNFTAQRGASGFRLGPCEAEARRHLPCPRLLQHILGYLGTPLAGTPVVIASSGGGRGRSARCTGS